MGKQTKRKVSSVDKKGKRRERKRKEERRRKRNRIEREKETKMKIFPAFRQSKLDDPRRKFDPHIESYTFVPKSWSFVKLHEVWNFPTLIIYSLKVI